MVSPEGIVLRASRALHALLGQDPVGLSFVSLLANPPRCQTGAQLPPGKYVLRDTRGGYTTISLAGGEVSGGTVLIGSGAQVTHSDILAKMSKLENQLTSANRDLQKKVHELEQARQEIQILSGMLPICMHCKSIRDDAGYWTRVEQYLSDRADVVFSHGICEACLQKYYPDLGLNGH